MKTRRSLTLALAAVLTLAAATQACAAYTLTLSQVGSNVVITGSGTVNTAALTFASNTPFSSSFKAGSSPIALVGAGTGYIYAGAIGPNSFGTGSQFLASSSTGTLAGIFQASVVTPATYVSGTFMTGTSTYNNQSFTSLGFVPGTYVYTWGSGATADSMTVTGAIPEPSTWALLAAGAGLLGLRLRRSSR